MKKRRRYKTSIALSGACFVLAGNNYLVNKSVFSGVTLIVVLIGCIVQVVCYKIEMKNIKKKSTK